MPSASSSDLIHYPYGCLEQTTSQVIPMIAVRDLADSLAIDGLTGPALERFVTAGITKIGRHQTPSGGFRCGPATSPRRTTRRTHCGACTSRGKPAIASTRRGSRRRSSTCATTARRPTSSGREYFDETGAPKTSFRVGDVVHVKLTAELPGDADHLMLSDALPAGFEPLPTRFATGGPAGAQPTESGGPALYDPFRDRPRVLARRGHILALMQQHGYLSAEDRAFADRVPIELAVRE